MNQLYSMCADLGFTPHVVQETDRAAVLMDLVGGGFGISIYPIISPWQERTDICFRRIAGAPDFEYSVVWKRETDNPVVHNLLRLLKRDRGALLRQ